VEEEERDAFLSGVTKSSSFGVAASKNSLLVE